MSQVLRTTKRLPTETLSLEAHAGLDVQGKPTYGTAADFDAHVVLYDVGASRDAEAFITGPDGSRVHIPLTLYVRGDAETVPGVKDRVTRDEETYIVMELKSVSGLRHAASAPDHYRIRCRDE